MIMKEAAYDPADTDCVVSAANYLEVSEFTVFRNAYTAWYGKEVPEKVVERLFMQYLLQNRVPFWVRSYARNLVPEQDGLSQKTGRESSLANNLLYLAAVIAEYALLASYLVLR